MRPSDRKLAAALHEAGLDEMAKRAEEGITTSSSARPSSTPCQR